MTKVFVSGRALPYAPWFVLICYAFLIAHSSLSSDELFTVYFSSQGIDWLSGEGWRIETNPPLYYLAEHFLFSHFGTSPATARILSLIAMAAAVPVIAAIGRRCGLGAAAPLPGLLFVLGGLPAYYALCARPYALWTLAIAVAILGLLHCTAALRAAAAPGAKSLASTGSLYAAGIIPAFYIHAATVPFFLAANVVFFLTWSAVYLRRREGIGALLGWCLIQLVAIVTAAPQFMVMAHQIGSANIDWIPRTSVANTAQVVGQLLGGYDLQRRVPFVAPLLFVMLPMIALGAWRGLRSLLDIARSLHSMDGRPIPGQAGKPAGFAAALDLAILGLAGFAIPLAISFVQPVFVSKTVMWLLIPGSVLLALAIMAYLPLELRGRAFAALALFSGISTASLLWAPGEPWREFLANVAAGYRSGDAVIVVGNTPVTGLAYYLPKTLTANAYRWTAPEFPPYAGAAGTILDARIAALPAFDPAVGAAILAKGQTVWVIDRHSPATSTGADAALAQVMGVAGVQIWRQKDDRVVVTKLTATERAAAAE